MSTPWSNTRAHVYTELGSWGMPTIDAEGLSALALLRFVDIPLTLKSGASRAMTSSNLLPVVVFRKPSTSPSSSSSTTNAQSSVSTGLAELIGVLASDVTLPDPNKSLTPVMVAESTAFVSLMQSRFGPARQHELFRIDRNYNDIYHTLLEKERSFPLNRILPMLRRKQVLNSLKDRSAQELYFESNIALAALSTRLGEGRKFFYRDQPSVLDAVVFGYLASVLYTPLSESTLRVQISKFKNLVDFTKRIAQLYFDDSDDENGNNTDGNRISRLFDSNAKIDLNLAERNATTQEHTRAHERARRATAGAPNEDIEELSEEEKERRRWNGYFLWGSVAIFVTHLLVGSEIEFEIS